MPSGGGLAEGIAHVRQEARADSCLQLFPIWVATRPGKDETDVVRDYRTDLFNDECCDALRMPSSELIRIRTAEGVSEQNSLRQIEERHQCRDIAEIVLASVSPGVA